MNLDDLPVNPVDAAVIATLLISAVLAFARGMVREVLAIASWVGAVFAVLYLQPLAQPFLRGYIENTLLADVLTGAAIFILALTLLSIIGMQLSRLFQKSSPGALDRSLGFVFGLVRGAILAGLAYLVFTFLWTQDNQPAWLQEARTRPLMEATAEVLNDLAPTDGWRQASETAAARAAETQRQLNQANDVLRNLSTPLPALPNLDASNGESGYNANDRSHLNRLFETAD